MDREQAEQALSIIRGVIENTRQDLIAQNWGMIWLLHAVTNGLGFASIGWFVERRGLPLLWYLLPPALLAVVDLVIVLLLAERDRGVRSYLEGQLHGVWTTFVIVTAAGAVALHLANLPPTLFCPLIALTSAFGFAMMGVIFYRQFFFAVVAFLGLALLSSLPSLKVLQWYLLGALWCSSMFVPGLIMHRERLRRGKHERGARIL